MKKKYLISYVQFPLCLLCALFFCLTILAQNNVVIKGLVVDENNEPVIGANITLKGNKAVGTIADVDGNFQLSVPDYNVVLEVSFIGMTTKEVKVGKRMPIRIVLSSDNVQLEEVVVVGFGQQKKESVIGSISQTTSKDLEKTGGLNNLSAALTGNLPGLITVQNNGLPGEDNPTLLIRGQTTWNGSSPLVLVDGIERPLSDVDINSVETISILKDASATAVYGVRGANGVVLITTKRGEEGKASINIGANITLKTVSKLPGKLDAYDAQMLRNQIAEYELPRFPDVWNEMRSQSLIDKYRFRGEDERDEYGTLLTERYPNVDWQDVVFKDAALSYNFNMGIRGGTKKLKYFVSADYSHEGDLFKEFDSGRGYNSKFEYDRLNTRSNIDFQLTNTTVFKVNLFASYGKRSYPPGAAGSTTNVDRYMNSVYNLPAYIFYPQYEDGAYGFSSVGGANNPLVEFATRGLYEVTNTRISADFVLEQDLKFILKGLSFKAALSWDNRFREEDRGIKDRDPGQSGGVFVKYINPIDGTIELDTQNQGYDSGTQFDWVPSVGWTTRGGVTKNGSTYRGLNYNAQLNYTQKFAKLHDVTLMVNAMRQEYSSSSNIPTYREDYVFRGTYDYAKRYFFEYNGAYNGSEKFAPENRFGFFSSGAIGWMISEEKFMKKIKFLDMLKLRLSYGKIGDDNIGERWIYMSEWAYGGAVRLGTEGAANNVANSPYSNYRRTKLGNEKIKWETVTKKNIGADFALFKGLIAGSVDFFKDERNDIIIKGSDRSTPDFFGESLPTANLGKMKASGYELEIRFNKKLNKDARIWAKYNMTHAKNTVIDRDDPELQPDYLKKAGHSNGQNYSFNSIGNYNTIDQLYGTTAYESSDFKTPGGLIVVDYNGDGIISNNYDKVPYAYTGSPENTFNLGIGFDYKGFSAFVQFYGVSNVTRVIDQTGNAQQGNLYELEDPYWTKELGYGAPYGTIKSTIHGAYKGSYFVYDGSYIRLKNAEIAYTFGEKLVKKFGLQSVKVYLNGNNLLMWSKMPDELETGGLGSGKYPMSRRYNLGLKLNF